MHPNCLCHIVPVVKKRVDNHDYPREPRIPEEVIRKAAPKYIETLDALGIDWRKLFDWESGKWKVRKRDILNAIGKEGWEELKSLASTPKEKLINELTNPQRRMEIANLVKGLFDAIGIPLEVEKAHLVPALGVWQEMGI